MPSYSPVYSVPFVQSTPGAPNMEFAVPAGFTAVIRQISFVQEVGATAVWVTISDDLEAPELTIAQQYEYGAFIQWQQQGRWVVPGGGYIVLHASTIGSDLSAYIGGYLLRNTL